MAQLLAKRRFWFWALTIATAAVIIVGMRLTPKAASSVWVYGEIPEFQLTERSGKEVSLTDLKGKIWIADFIFTRCAAICPMMTGRMRMIQEKFKDNPNIAFVSFSVDPEYDTPQRLTEYAKRFEADPEKWLFLTGDKQKIHQLSQQHFRLGIMEVPEADREAPDQTVDHSSKFVLVDGQARIRGYYASEELDFLDKLAKDVIQLQKE